MPVAARPIAMHVLTRLVLGGPTRPVLTSLDRMSHRGVRTVLVTGSPERHEREARELLAEYPDLPVLRVGSLVRSPRPVADVRALAALTAAVKRLRPTVIHTHTAKAGGLGRLAACLSGSCGIGRRGGPTLRVHTFHGHSLDRTVSGWPSVLWRFVERRLARRATDVVLAVSPGQRDDLVGRLGRSVRDRIAVVPLAHDLNRFDGSARTSRAERAGDGERLLLFVGRGVPVKGLGLLASAHARVEALRKGGGRGLRVVIAGPMQPGERQRAESVLREAGLAEQWDFLGPVPHPAGLYESADVVVLPSRSEGTPVSVIEALSLGRPVIASAVGGVPELLRCRWERSGAGLWETRPCSARGALVAAGDREAWARALEQTLDGTSFIPGDPVERRRFVASVFDADERTRELMQIYELPGAGAGLARRGGGRGPKTAAPRAASRVVPPPGGDAADAGQPRPAV